VPYGNEYYHIDVVLDSNTTLLLGYWYYWWKSLGRKIPKLFPQISPEY
jgi:hypothetical protein